MDIQGAVLQLLVAAAPAVVLYFTGWSYLYFYLDSFQINVSEVNLDLPTVFIYAYPPLHTLWEFHGTTIALLISVSAILLVAGEPAWRWTVRLPHWLRILLGVHLVRYLARRTRTVSSSAWTIGLLFVLVFVLPFPLARLTAWAAAHSADKIWDGQTVELDPVFEKEAVSATAATEQPIAREPLGGGPSAIEEQQAPLIANYLACMRHGRLGLIFSVEAHYYLLCPAVDDPDSASMFEVTGKEGLISVRRVSRIGQ